LSFHERHHLVDLPMTFPFLLGLALATAPTQAAAADAPPPPPAVSAPSPPADVPSAASAPAQAPEETPRPAPGEEAKPWAVSLDYEFHRFIAPRALAGDITTVQALLLRGSFSFTRHDEVALAAGAFLTYLTELGTTGVRGGDIALRYTHRFDLPLAFRLAASVSATVPTSYSSQLASNITVPGATVALSREFGDLALSLSALGRYYWNQHPTGSTALDSGTATVNLNYSVGGVLGADYALPFFRALSFGARIVAIGYWYDSPGTTSPVSAFGSGTFVATSTAPASQQNYGWDLRVTYAPKLDWLVPSVTIGVGNTTTWLVTLDDVAQYYFFGTERFDVYAALGAGF
jgi:hypothetical protein